MALGADLVECSVKNGCCQVSVSRKQESSANTFVLQITKGKTCSDQTWKK